MFVAWVTCLFVSLIAALECGRVKDLKDKASVMPAIRTAVMSKQYGYEEFLAGLICDACLTIMPDHQKSFNVDRIRVCKIMVSSLEKNYLVNNISDIYRALVGSVHI